jgi:hypothetical protein
VQNARVIGIIFLGLSEYRLGVVIKILSTATSVSADKNPSVASAAKMLILFILIGAA